MILSPVAGRLLRIALALVRSRYMEKNLGGHPQCPPRMGCGPATRLFRLNEYFIGTLYQYMTTAKLRR